MIVPSRSRNRAGVGLMGVENGKSGGGVPPPGGAIGPEAGSLRPFFLLKNAPGYRESPVREKEAPGNFPRIFVRNDNTGSNSSFRVKGGFTTNMPLPVMPNPCASGSSTVRRASIHPFGAEAATLASATGSSAEAGLLSISGYQTRITASAKRPSADSTQAAVRS